MSLRFLFLIPLMAAAAFGQGTILWQESVNGPLSNTSDVPTCFNARSGGNQ